MNRKILALIIGSAFISALAMGNMKISKIHKSFNKDGAKIDCTYCHKTNQLPKKHHNIHKIQKKAFCSGKGCHNN